MLKKEVFGDAELNEDDISCLVSLTQQLFNEVERELKLTGFWESIPARNKLKADIQRTLLQPEFSKLAGACAKSGAHYQSHHGNRREEQRHDPLRRMMELEYKIVRSPRRKKLTITVERDRAIIVHAPEGTSEEDSSSASWTRSASGYSRSFGTRKNIKIGLIRRARKL